MIDFIEEEEWYSVCCTAPPLYDIDTDYDEPIGICMHCRDNTTFSQGEDDESNIWRIFIR